MRYLFIFLFCFNAYAQIYIAPTLGLSYGSSNETAYSGLLGVNAGVAGGFRQGSLALEVGIKRTTLSNSSIGSSDFESEITNDSYFGGARLFLGELFVISGGFTSHNLDFTINKDNGTVENLEQNGSYTSFYAGAGINSKLGSKGDFFWEGTLYPMPDVDLFQVDFLAGVRLYL